MDDSDSGGLHLQCFLMTENETVQISVVYLTGQAKGQTAIVFVKKKKKATLSIRVF